MKVYSLANYQLTLENNNPNVREVFGTLSIGGQGKKIGSITINQANAPFKIETFATGGYYYNKTLDKSGSVSINLNQLADEIIKFRTLIELYFNNDFEDDNGFTITVNDISNGNSKAIASCIGCMPTSNPSLSLGNEAGEQTWTFSCGIINFATN